MKIFAKQMGKKLKLSAGQLDELNLLAALHDLGKISIADSIILKPGKLNDEEWKLIKKHPEIGYRISQSSLQLAPISNAILSHHENWDGSGYPHGLRKSEIPLISRIISIVDAYDAMTSDRPYRKAMSKADAIKELKRCSGTQFDPDLVKFFIDKVLTSKKYSQKEKVGII
jgi:HD-GYP domain-containing protein (c-di-GMP phosphodiesterase class II)